MSRDGDSLFATLAHQLMVPPVGSPQHRQDILSLLGQVWQDLMRHLDNYDELVHQSVLFHGDRYSNLPSLEEKVNVYIGDLLTEGFPGGVEVIQATSN
ncbi:hypothetical protein PR048_026857 [Dryococelus australis]|uniref:Uncharacterized protein n=1 Tax=Dryococelus australis TaxID=614101 RepID=A0ABQ9GMJ4_9NEOP|nr:hypothetical protein PR048_026857 [Dryococelus australis]